MIAQFASREVESLAVTLELPQPNGAAATHEGVTDTEGFVHFDVAIPDRALPPGPAWEAVRLQWRTDIGLQSCDGLVLAPGADTRLGIISDIDDTIIETGITGNIRAILRNAHRVIAQLPDERIAVPGADAFYTALGGETTGLGEGADTASTLSANTQAASERPFFYVSSSPWNLFSYLVTFQRSRGLPLGPMFLRDWGFNARTLGKSSHGTHKRDAIETILTTYPNMQFALIGDDTQGDLPAYGAVVERHPDRIAAVFIRTAGEEFSAEEHAAKALIEQSGVPLWLGHSYDSGQAFLQRIGLAQDADAQHILDAVEPETGKASDGES